MLIKNFFRRFSKFPQIYITWTSSEKILSKIWEPFFRPSATIHHHRHSPSVTTILMAFYLHLHLLLLILGSMITETPNFQKKKPITYAELNPKTPTFWNLKLDFFPIFFLQIFQISAHLYHLNFIQKSFKQNRRTLFSTKKPPLFESWSRIFFR